MMGRATRHSTWSNRTDAFSHKGYVPGEYDPTTGITNPETRGYRSWRYHNSIAGPGGLLARLEAFTGNSIRAVWSHDETGSTYTVYSFDQDIASWHVPDPDPNDPGRDLPVVQASTRYYSNKTTEHQHNVLAWMGHAVDKWIAPAEYGD